MNDFTKEELQDINYALTEYGDFESARMETLIGKIQSMIDSHCEHEGYPPCECGQPLRLLSFSPHVLAMCDKCRKTYVGDGFPG